MCEVDSPPAGVLCQNGVVAVPGVVPEPQKAFGVNPGVAEVVGGAWDQRGTAAADGLPTLSCDPGEGGMTYMLPAPGEDGGIHICVAIPGDGAGGVSTRLFG